MLTAATFDHVGLRSRIPTSSTSISWVRVTPTTDTIEYLMASAPRPPVTRSRTAAGDIFTASDPTGPTLRFPNRSEEHTSELQSLMRTSYAVFGWTQNTTT